MKVIIVTQARIGSKRLPNKVLLKVNNLSLLKIHLKRLKKSKLANEIILATTFENGIDKILTIGEDEGIFCFQGSVEDVLDRFYKSVKLKKPDYIVRVTSDCPMIDPELIDDVISFTIKNNLDYSSNVLIHNFPDGQDVEVFRFSSLENAWKNARLNSEREHVTPYIINNSSFHKKNLFSSLNYSIHFNRDYSKVRMTVDEKGDYEAIKIIIERIGINLRWHEYADFILNNPSLFLNQKIIRNYSYLNQLEIERDEKSNDRSKTL